MFYLHARRALANVSSDYKHLTPNHTIPFHNLLIMIHTFPLSLLFLPITLRSRSTLVPIIPLSRFSRAACGLPNPYLALGKPVEEAGTKARSKILQSRKDTCKRF